MRTSSRRIAAAAALLLAAAPARAQESPAALTPYASLGVGATLLPDRFRSSCGGARKELAAELRAGVRVGRIALEARGANLGFLGETTCVYDVAAPSLPPVDGVHPEREYSFGEDQPAAMLDLRLRYGGTPRIPVTMSVGGGVIADNDVPYLLAGLGYRGPGSVRLALDAEANWYRVKWVDRQVEWQGGTRVGVVSEARTSEWWTGLGVRVGVEVEAR